jgi:phospholipid-transporting ATPase
MTDDFLRLVSQANPASQYQPANNGYPPSQSNNQFNNDRSPQLIDPFFDDDDDNLPDSTFGHPDPMKSQESGLPLAKSAAAPAGHSKVTLGDGVPQGWNFDDDDIHPTSAEPFAGSGHFPGTQPQKSPPTKSKSRKWKWPWEKEKELTGERVVALNNSAANDEFCSNFVSTSKYNLGTFLPKFLFGASLYPCLLAVTLINVLQSNSRNTPTCSSCSPPSSSKYPESLQQTGTQRSHRLQLCC